MKKVVACIEGIGFRRSGGIWHLGGREDINYAEAGRHLARRLGADEKLVQPTSAAAGGIPKDERPVHTVLVLGEIETMTGVRNADAWTELDIGLGFADWSRTDDEGDGSGTTPREACETTSV